MIVFPTSILIYLSVHFIGTFQKMFSLCSLEVVCDYTLTNLVPLFAIVDPRVMMLLDDLSPKNVLTGDDSKRVLQYGLASEEILLILYAYQCVKNK